MSSYHEPATRDCNSGTDNSSKRVDEPQPIAAWQMLYRVQSHIQKQGSSADGLRFVFLLGGTDTLIKVKEVIEKSVEEGGFRLD